jgi:hypothetical protein
MTKLGGYGKSTLVDSVNLIVKFQYAADELPLEALRQEPAGTGKS